MIVLSYYEASLVVDHLMKTYGPAKLNVFLRAYGKGLDTDAALKEAYGVSVDQVQQGFDAALDRDFGALRRAMKRIDIPADATAQQPTAPGQSNPRSFVAPKRPGA